MNYQQQYWSVLDYSQEQDRELKSLENEYHKLEAERDGYLEALNGSQRDLLAVMDERDEARRWARRMKDVIVKQSLRLEFEEAMCDRAIAEVKRLQAWLESD
jgi:hypothetical protein